MATDTVPSEASPSMSVGQPQNFSADNQGQIPTTHHDHSLARTEDRRQGTTDNGTHAAAEDPAPTYAVGWPQPTQTPEIPLAGPRYGRDLLLMRCHQLTHIQHIPNTATWWFSIISMSPLPQGVPT